LRNISCAEDLVLSFGIGSGSLGLIALLLGLAGSINIPVFTGAAVLVIIFCFPGLEYFRNIYKSLIAGLKEIKISAGFIFGTFIICLVLFMSFCSALPPPTAPLQSDELRYHLADPDRYVMDGIIKYHPESAFSNFPFIVETQFMTALIFANDTSARVIHWLYFAASLLLVSILLGKIVGNGKRMPGILVAVTIPFAPILAGFAFIDCAFAFYSLLSLMVWMKWYENKENRYLYCLGVILGLCLGVKYTAIFVGFIFLVMSLYVSFRKHETRPAEILRITFITFLLTAAVSCPWFIKSYAWTGNPVYPLAYNTFGGDDWGSFNNDFYSHHAGQKGDMNGFKRMSVGGKAWDLVSLLWRPSFNKLHTGGKNWFADWLIGPAFIMIIPLLFFIGKVDKRIWWLTFFAACYTLVWALTYLYNRFLLPALMTLAVAAGYIIHRLEHGIDWPWLKGLVLLIFYFVIGLNSLWITTALTESYLPWSVITGRITRTQHLHNESIKFDQFAYYPAFEYLNDNLIIGEKVILVGEYRSYYLKCDNITSDFFDSPAIIEYLRPARSRMEVLMNLRAAGITHILYNENELSNNGRAYEKLYSMFFSEVGWKKLQSFRQSLENNVVYSENNVIIYKLPGPESTDAGS
jgi:hypothetical protein